MTAPDPSQERASAPIRSRSGRRLTVFRRLGYWLAVYAAILIIELLWRTCRIRIVGEEALKHSLAQHGAAIPVCWHQHLILCSRYWVAKRVPHLRPGFMISPSVDGEAPTLLAQWYGAQVIRGSGTYTGARAVRHLYKAIVREKLSPLVTPDGPRGPRFQFKGGAALLAQLCQVPLVPLAFAARPAYMFKTWDKFIFPWPFARVVLAVGEPILLPRDLSAAREAELESEMAQRMHDAYRRARDELGG